MPHDVRQINQLRDLQGRRVSLALVGGSRIDDAQLISAGGRGVKTVWVVSNGVDTFLPLVDVVDVWEAEQARHRPRAAA